MVKIIMCPNVHESQEYLCSFLVFPGWGGQSGERSRNEVEIREQINFYILVCIIPLITSLKHARICLILIRVPHPKF